jgi:hypothetical protein
MDRHASWFPLVALVLVVVGLVTLAAPPPAQAFDPQLALALASAAGAVALIVGYLIVANGRDRQRAASLEGVYTCSDQEAASPMGCGGPGSAGAAAPSALTAVLDGPMVAQGGSTASLDTTGALGQPCPAGQAAGPMGCGAAEPVYAAPGPSGTAVLSAAVQGQ